MRRAGQKRTVSPPTTPLTTPQSEHAPGSLLVELDVCSASIPTSDSVAAERPVASTSAKGGVGSIETAERALRRRRLSAAIRKRIESRLHGRVRDLVVRIHGDRVVLEGECATYYTKQLAQHAALGILEDEHLDNQIVVNIPQ